MSTVSWPTLANDSSAALLSDSIARMSAGRRRRSSTGPDCDHDESQRVRCSSVSWQSAQSSRCRLRLDCSLADDRPSSIWLQDLASGHDSSLLTSISSNLDALFDFLLDADHHTPLGEIDGGGRYV